MKPINWRLVLARACLGAVLLWNLSAAVPFAFRPERYLASFQVSGVGGVALVQGLGRGLFDVAGSLFPGHLAAGALPGLFVGGIGHASGRLGRGKLDDGPFAGRQRSSEGYRLALYPL